MLKTKVIQTITFLFLVFFIHTLTSSAYGNDKFEFQSFSNVDEFSVWCLFSEYNKSICRKMVEMIFTGEDRYFEKYDSTSLVFIRKFIIPGNCAEFFLYKKAFLYNNFYHVIICPKKINLGDIDGIQ